MRLPIFFAFRYLFSRSRINAISWVAMISALAIGLVTAALVCVLSVYNGYVALLLGNSSDLDPELVIKHKAGKAFQPQEYSSLEKALRLPSIKVASKILQTQAILQYEGNEQFVQIIGVDSLFHKVSKLPNRLISGQWLPTQKQDSTDISLCISGFHTSIPLANQTTKLAHLYLPKREGMINPLVPASAFEQIQIHSIGDLDLLREDIDQSLFLPLDIVQALLGYTSGEVGQIALRLQDSSKIEETKQTLSNTLGENFVVQDRESQHPELTYLIKTEKMITYLIMFFILILATFNIASTLIMLMIEKEQNIHTLQALGAGQSLIAQIFSSTGMLISTLGVAGGLVLGLAFCYIQKYTGVLASGSGIGKIPFPIEIVWSDFVTIILSTLGITFLIILYSVFVLGKRPPKL